MPGWNGRARRVAHAPTHANQRGRSELWLKLALRALSALVRASHFERTARGTGKSSSSGMSKSSVEPPNAGGASDMGNKHGVCGAPDTRFASREGWTPRNARQQHSLTGLHGCRSTRRYRRCVVALVARSGRVALLAALATVLLLLILLFRCAEIGLRIEFHHPI